MKYCIEVWDHSGMIWQYLTADLPPESQRRLYSGESITIWFY